jgi:hypothetical protein
MQLRLCFVYISRVERRVRLFTSYSGFILTIRFKIIIIGLPEFKR